jgi:hypothetical protein
MSCRISLAMLALLSFTTPLLRCSGSTTGWPASGSRPRMLETAEALEIRDATAAQEAHSD